MSGFGPQAVGPRGGDLSTPYHPGDPAWRQKGFNGENVNGERGLHRFVKNHDVAASSLKDEQPWHRMAAYMLNAGRTNSEIALAADVNVNTVTILRSQRWFQELCATIANENGEEILGAIKSYALDAVEELASLMRGAENESVRRAAARDILEQAHGKPIQKIVSSVSHSRLSASEEMQQIEQELEALRSKTS